MAASGAAQPAPVPAFAEPQPPLRSARPLVAAGRELGVGEAMLGCVAGAAGAAGAASEPQTSLEPQASKLVLSVENEEVVGFGAAAG